MILLTGASGVIGHELVGRLPQARLLVARHRTRPESHLPQIAIDIRSPRLGLDAADFEALCNRIDTIVHCAAITDMSGQVPELSATNISGVQHVIDLAEAASAKLHFISTAYCSESYGPAAPVASDYVASKRAAEGLVRESKTDWTIIRPSIIAGHSETGAIASHQGFHMFITTVLKGRLPIIPLARETQCDFVPVDWVAEAIAKIVENPEWGRTYWLTSGAAALTIGEMMEVGTPTAEAYGRDLSGIDLIPPQKVKAEVLPLLRPRSAERLRRLINLSEVMSRARPFPSDLEDVSAARLEAAFLANVEEWVRTQG